MTKLRNKETACDVCGKKAPAKVFMAYGIKLCSKHYQNEQIRKQHE